MSGRVAVLAYPLGEDFGLGRAKPHTPLRVYRRAVLEKANPRSPDYMRRLLDEHHGDDVTIVGDPAEAAAAREIVLLYPDAIGLGFGRLERRLPRGVPVQVLTGRRRAFTLDARTRRRLRRRRFLERALVGEAIGLALAVAATPALLAVDLVRGRR